MVSRVGDSQRFYKVVPFLGDGQIAWRHGLVGAGIPVGCVSVIPLLPVEVPMNPASGVAWDVLAKVMCGIPLPSARQP